MTLVVEAIGKEEANMVELPAHSIRGSVHQPTGHPNSTAEQKLPVNQRTTSASDCDRLV